MSIVKNSRKLAAKSEAEHIINILTEKFPKHIDGREAIVAMKNNGSNNWRQTEWMGYFFEEVALAQVSRLSEGPTVKNTQFDAEGNYVWDFKTHSKKTESGNKRYQMYLNDNESTEKCIQNGGMGFIAAYLDVEYDENQEFYDWHTELKGGPSDYTKNRRERGTSSRTRKVSFDFDRIEAYWIDNLQELSQAVEDGWMKVTGQGRNSDGSQRSEKYILKPHNIPSDAVVVEETFE
jgi:hypothetical protein